MVWVSGNILHQDRMSCIYVCLFLAKQANRKAHLQHVWLISLSYSEEGIVSCLKDGFTGLKESWVAVFQHAGGSAHQ